MINVIALVLDTSCFTGFAMMMALKEKNKPNYRMFVFMYKTHPRFRRYIYVEKVCIVKESNVDLN